MNKFNLLLIDDDTLVHETAKAEFSDTGINLFHAHSGKDGLKIFRESPLKFPVVLLDYSMPDVLGDEVTEQILEINSKQMIVIYSADQTRDTLKKTILAGAVDFLEKDLDFEVKIEKLKEHYNKWKTLYATYEDSKTNSEKQEYINKFDLEGQSDQLYKICKQVEVLATKDTTVLINGPSGTGKSDLAKAIVKSSKRQSYPFKTINCGAISEKLVESELFGHAKGSFTGADKEKIGLFESCNHGTIFLDEIGDLPLAMQVKLLRVLQDQVIMKVGSTKEVPINVRIIAATNKDLEEEIQKKQFREDLYYRLNVVVFDMPPLAERNEEVPLLVDKFLKENKEVSFKITLQALDFLRSYAWPGNIRELKNEINRIMALSTGNIIRVEHLSAKIFQKNIKTIDGSVQIKNFDSMKLKQYEIERSYWQQLIQTDRKLSVAETIQKILNNHNLSRSTLYRKFKELNIKVENYKGVENVL
jgi:DNA-binding NtrC family response regulator